MKKLSLLSLIFLTVISCSSIEETAKEDQKKEEVYVFDDVSKVDSAKVEIAVKKDSVAEKKVTTPVIINSAGTKLFTIQFGAFTTKERAELFIKENQQKTSVIMSINYNSGTKLFVIQSPTFSTKEETDKVRDTLRSIPVFKDSFTKVTDNK